MTLTPPLTQPASHRQPHETLATQPIRVAVLGAGGLGKAAARIIGVKQDLRLVAICDSHHVAYRADGLNKTAIANHMGTLEVSCEPAARLQQTDDPIGRVIELAGELDGVVITLPNMPNEFIPGVIQRFTEARQGLVFVDVLKRSRAVEQMFELDAAVRASRSVVLTGCGATPGLLSAAAVLAAQSFIQVERVDIWWGVGIANWDAYKATIREDIAHVPGYSVERAQAMTDQEVEAFLAKTNGLLELHQM